MFTHLSYRTEDDFKKLKKFWNCYFYNQDKNLLTEICMTIFFNNFKN